MTLDRQGEDPLLLEPCQAWPRPNEVVRLTSLWDLLSALLVFSRHPPTCGSSSWAPLPPWHLARGLCGAHPDAGCWDERGPD